MEKNSLGIILIGGLLSFILYKSDAIGGFGFFVCLIIIFVASAIVAGNAKSKKIMERGQLLNEKLNNIENFTATKKLIGNGNKYFIALDEGREKIVFLGDNIKKISFSDVLGCEIIEDGETISKKSTTRTIGGALIGGVLAGGSGAIIGGLSGKTTEKKEVTSLVLKILLRDISNPTITIDCFNASEVTNGTKKKIKTDDSVYGPIYKAVKKELNTVKDVFSIVIDKVDKKEKVELKTDVSTNSLSDELLKLNDLKEKGILNNEEFEVQKKKLLNQ